MQQISRAQAGRRTRSLLWVLAWMTFVSGWNTEAAAVSSLRQFALNLDGEVFEAGDPFPSSIDVSGFDLATGIGMVRVTYTDNPGAHAVLAFFDHDIDAATNTFFNEVGGVAGTPAAGQSWEIDEPGFVLGDLRDNFVSGALDGAIGMSVFGTTTFPDDVALAMGWDFTLEQGEEATVLFSVDNVQPIDFYLFQTDPDSGETIYLTSRLVIVPEPGTGVLLGGGLAAFSALRRGRRDRGGPPTRAAT